MIAPHNLCEYYFDSRVERVVGDEENIKTPHIYFERNLEKPALPYRLYAVVDEWVPPYGQGDIPYDSVQICYGQGVNDCAAVYSKKTALRTYMKSTARTEPNLKSIDKYGNILEINEATNFNPTGVGSIEMFKGEKRVAKFYFAVTCVFRKKIFYTLEISGRQANITFECKSAPKDGIKAIVLAHEKRLPCLTVDRDNCEIEQLDLTFKRGKCIKSVELPDRIIDAPDRKLFVVLDKQNEDMFVLEQMHNDTLPISQPQAGLSPSYSCPFCHGEIKVNDLKKSKEYKQGGVACDSTKLKIGIRENSYKHKDKCLICRNELRDGALKQGEIHKILPDDYLGHDNFKIAFQGAPRAGKTTYISRFFGLQSLLNSKGKAKIAVGEEDDLKPEDFNFKMSMSEIKNTADQFGLKVDDTPILAVDDDGRISGQWQDMEENYIVRGMEIGRKLMSTDKKDYTRFPFTVEVNGKNYVSFYDIAGEDSKKDNEYVKKLAENDEKTIGIFFVITATHEEGSTVNAEVSKQLRQAGKDLSPDCPVAIILSKMDVIGNRFDSSCACRRFNYYPTSVRGRDFIYDGSDVAKFINDSSEEIKAFIENEGGVDIENSEKENDDVQRFKNVKYFCISSFGCSEATYRSGEGVDEESYMRFSTSTRRMDLPFLWMMRQFNIIK